MSAYQQPENMATALGNGKTALTATTIPATKTDISVTLPIATTAPSETNFGVKLFNLITENRNEVAENVIISPLLLESMLALLYLGSDGVTAEQLKNILQLQRFNGSNAKMANYYAAHLGITTTTTTRTATGTPLQTATKIELAQKILLLHAEQQLAEEFQKIAKKYFQTTTATTTTTMESVNDLTTQLNETLASMAMKPLNETTTTTISANGGTSANAAADTADAIVLLAANLKSKWFLPFSAYRSGYYDFHAKPEQHKSVAMLFDDDMFVKFGEFRDLDAKAIELPYECDCADDDYVDELAMLLILPNQRDGINGLMAKLQSIDLSTLAERMQMESVQVLLPKFTVDYECSLGQYFDELGLSTIHSKLANFRNLLAEHCRSGPAVRIQDVVHKVRIAVNESGSEVANMQVNKPIVLSNSFGPKKKFFRADHPFYFAVRSNEVTYFLGCVTQL